jgi:hypothetical protein
MGDVCQQAFNLGFQTGTMKDSTTMIAALGMKHYHHNGHSFVGSAMHGLTTLIITALQ